MRSLLLAAAALAVLTSATMAADAPPPATPDTTTEPPPVVLTLNQQEQAAWAQVGGGMDQCVAQASLHSQTAVCAAVSSFLEGWASRVKAATPAGAPSK